MSVGITPAAARVNAVATRQHGIVDHLELRGASIAQQTISGWARRGHLHRIYAGVYSIVPPSMLTQEALWLAAVKACGPGAALSHGPAAQLEWLIDRRERFGLHVTVPDRSRRRVPGIVIHRPRSFDSKDVVVRCGIPTTSIARTVFDLAYSSPHRLVAGVYELADGNDRLDRERLTTLTTEHPTRRGSRLIRSMLAESSITLAGIRSWLEGVAVRVCSRFGLPMPVTNVPLLGYEADLLWEPARFVVEADGGHHMKKTQRDKDNARDLAFGRAGYLVRRYSSRDLSREAQVAAEIAEILRERTPG
jgi:hypothetical protein